MSEINDAHLLAFGKIVHRYAEVEWGLRCILAGLVEIPLLEAFVLTEPHSAAGLKNVVQSAAKISNLSEADQETLLQITGNWSRFSKLRNAIAHRRWEEGSRSGSIRPVGIDIRSGKAKMVGDIEDRDWTQVELNSEVQKLDQLNERAKTFFTSSGLAQLVAEKNKEAGNRAEAKLPVA